MAGLVLEELGSGAGAVVDDLPARLPAYDIVIANILAQPLISLAPVFAALVRPGGALVLAGMLADQVHAVAEAHAPSFDVDPPRHRDAWAILVGRRRAANP